MDGEGGGGVTLIGDVIVDFVKKIVKPLKNFKFNMYMGRQFRVNENSSGAL